MPEGRKYNSKKKYESRIQKFDSNYKLKFLKSTSDTGRHQIHWNFDKFRKISEKVFDRKCNFKKL